ncbi:head GIN domain-containing protein [Sphingomonas sp. LHG3443-2]|uniref:head GIN domain-containing protein n=1 Tax=Sphingomonas sp. LHG3443-2 TaxID=2804639 RepID=UPI003CF96A77
MILVAAAAIALSLSSESSHPERSASSRDQASSPPAAEANPSPYQSRDVAVGRFDRLKVSGPFKVGVLVSREPRLVRLHGPPALLGDVVVAVEGDTLAIRFREGAAWSWNPGSGVNIVVSATSLASVNLEGAADVEISGVRGETFAAATAGAGVVRATLLDVGQVHLTTGGSGGITVDGSAREATYVVGSSGSIDAMRLRVRNASIAVAGAGSSYANVSGTANISSSGSGRIEVVGGATCIKQPADSRRIECR